MLHASCGYGNTNRHMITCTARVRPKNSKPNRLHTLLEVLPTPLLRVGSHMQHLPQKSSHNERILRFLV
eukprot:5487630-Amphidinium_carterae.1